MQKHFEPIALRAFLVLCWVTLFGIAQAEIQLEITATDPVSPATLAFREAFSLRIGYSSDRHVHIWAHPYYQGEQVARGGQRSNASPFYRQSLGEALAWFSFDAAAKVDEVRIIAVDENGRAPIAQISLSVDLDWTGLPNPSPRPQPEWLSSLQQSQRQQLSTQNAVGETANGWAAIIVPLMFLCFPVYLVMQWLALKRLSGAWRIAAQFAAVIMTVVVLFTAAAFIMQSNQWLLWLLFASPPALLYILILLAAAKYAAR